MTLFGPLVGLSRSVAYPEPVLPDRVAFARARIRTLLPRDVVQAHVDAHHQTAALKERGGLAEGSLGQLQAAVVAGTLLKVTSFLDTLAREDRALLNCLPNERSSSPEMVQAFARAGVSVQHQHQLGALMTLIDTVAQTETASRAALRLMEL